MNRSLRVLREKSSCSLWFDFSAASLVPIHLSFANLVPPKAGGMLIPTNFTKQRAVKIIVGMALAISL